MEFKNISADSPFLFITSGATINEKTLTDEKRIQWSLTIVWSAAKGSKQRQIGGRESFKIALPFSIEFVLHSGR